MALSLYHHPLASFCHKVVLALYENETPFESIVVDLADRGAHADFFAFWPIGKMPLLRDTCRDTIVPETSIIIEYLEQHYPGARPLLPRDAVQRLDTRLWDRFFDLYVQTPMQKIVTDRLRAEDEHDTRGVINARTALHVAYDMLDKRVRDKRWVMGDMFTMADCAAAPALFYAGIVESRPHPGAVPLMPSQAVELDRMFHVSPITVGRHGRQARRPASRAPFFHLAQLPNAHV